MWNPGEDTTIGRTPHSVLRNLSPRGVCRIGYIGGLTRMTVFVRANLIRRYNEWG